MRCDLCGLCGYGELRDDEDHGTMKGEEEAYRAAPRWKALIRRARRKLKGRPKVHTFRYDAVSYAMNFDEQGLLHHQNSRTSSYQF